jgi:hypothetical protein
VKYFRESKTQFTFLLLEMSERLKQHTKILKRLAKAPLEERRDILNKADKELINCISEIVYNTLRSNVPLNSTEVEKLKRFKISLRKIASKNISHRDKNKILRRKNTFCMAIKPLIKIVLSHILKV